MSPPIRSAPRDRLASEAAERVGGGRATPFTRAPRAGAPLFPSRGIVPLASADPDTTLVMRTTPEDMAVESPDFDSDPTLVGTSPLVARVDAPADPAPETAPPARPLFRQAAVAAHAGERDASAPLRAAPPWTSTVVGVTLGIVTAALTAACLVSLDVTARASGVMRPQQGGTQILAAQGSGLVAEVHVRSGDTVAAGDVIMTFDVASVRTELLEAGRKVEIAVALLHAEEERHASQLNRQRALASTRERSLQARAVSLRATAGRLQARVQRARESKAEGLATIAELEDQEEQLATAQRGALALEEEIVQLRAQTTSLVAEADALVARLRRDVKDAEAHRDAVAYALEHTKVVAPTAGTLDGLSVRPGDSVSVGTPVARIVPEGATTQIVVFLPERDRAFLTEDARVRIELAQLPVAEFGALGARVTRIGADVAAPDEIRAVLGPQVDLGGPAFRVELAVEDDARRERLARFLRPGSVVSARFALRKRRVITIFFEPLRGLLP